MRLVRFTTSGDARPRLGKVEGDEVLELADWAGDMVRLIADADRVFSSQPSARHPLGQVRLLAPMAPTTILCAGSNYHAHNREKAAAPLSGQEPEFFIKTADCVIGPEDEIPYDAKLTAKLDCETELAIVVGKPGRHIPVERALDHVFGYSIINDVTARDRQVRRKPDGTVFYELGRGKVFDGSAPFGPSITTSDEIPDPHRLRLRTRINGELRQSGHTSDMIWRCAELIHFFSINLTLRPGMVIITGTPAGTAWSADEELGGHWSPPEDGEPLVKARGYNQPGDIVESEIEHIGTLRVHVGPARG